MKKILFSFLTVLISLTTVNFAQTTAPVTFRLDLNDVIGSVPNPNSVQVFVQTSVTNWTDVPMQDIGGNGIWKKNINISYPSGQNVDVFYRFKVTSFGTNGLPYTLWEGGPNADVSCLDDPSNYGLAGGMVREVLVPQELIDNGTYTTTGEFRLTHCFNICGNEPCPPTPCNGFLNDSTWQMCWGDQAAIVFEWFTDPQDNGCNVNAVKYGNVDGAGPYTYPGNWPSSNGYNNFTVHAGNGQMPPNWDVPHYLVLQYESGLISDTIWHTPYSCIPGCTDPTQVSYNPFATSDDGSCSNTTSCDPIDHEITIEITLDNWPGETSWTLVSLSDGGIPAQASQGEYGFQDVGQTYTYTVCIDTLGVELIINDSWGDGLGGSTSGGSIDGNVVIYNCDGDTIWSLQPGVPNGNFGNVAYSGPLYGSACGGIPQILGCTDPMYQEFDPNANTDDGSCLTPHIFGCTDISAFNYDPTATMQQFIPVCDYTLILNDGAGDGWGNSYLGVSQNGNLWSYTMGPGDYNQSFQIPLESAYPVEIYYFEVQGPQQVPEEVEFQTMHNSFVLKNHLGDTLLAEGLNPFANNGLGALQPFEDPFWPKYTGLPNCGNSCIPKIFGCTDSTSLNYDPLANTDDNSCIPIIYGCTDSLAFNYDPTATVNDGSCMPFVYGCMDPASFNYNPLANVDDGNCIYLGCTDVTACNYDSTANVDNGGCMYPPQYYDCFGVCLEDTDGDGICDSLEIPGCTNPLSLNYNPNATDDDGSCIPFIYGCTDSTAYNYNPLANTDDGSCVPVVLGCTDPTMFNYNPNANVDDGSCIPIVYGCMDNTMFNYNPNANVDNGSCIPFIYGCTDSTAFNYDPLANTDNGTCIPIIYGCTDPSAFNYNPLANTEDFSCIPVVYGCTDSLAVNYDPAANVDNGSCITAVPGCTDPNAYNFDPNANVPDSASCLYDAGCITGPGNPYWLNDDCYAWVISIDPYCCNTAWDANCQSTYDYCASNSGWVGVEDLVYDGAIAVYPNPTTGELNVVSSRFKNVLVTMYSVSGQIVVNETSENVIDISHLENGVYFMNVKVGELTYIRKVIKQ